MEDDILQIEAAASRAMVPARPGPRTGPAMDPLHGTNEMVIYRGGQPQMPPSSQGAIEGPSFPALTHHNPETALMLQGNYFDQLLTKGATGLLKL